MCSWHPRCHSREHAIHGNLKYIWRNTTVIFSFFIWFLNFFFDKSIKWRSMWSFFCTVDKLFSMFNNLL
jgi:hypothetical protein